ncbi:hypothetical protein B0H10DRAFT_2050932, partial [Mycena sp. CBHHK59/15]
MSARTGREGWIRARCLVLALASFHSTSTPPSIATSPPTSVLRTVSQQGAARAHMTRAHPIADRVPRSLPTISRVEACVDMAHPSSEGWEPGVGTNSHSFCEDSALERGGP